MYLCLGDIIRMGGCCFESATGEVYFALTPRHNFWRPFLMYLLMRCALKSFLCLFECWETAKYRVECS